jgi:hypothetical protein
MAAHENHPDPTEVEVHGHSSFLSPNYASKTSKCVFVRLQLYPKLEELVIGLPRSNKSNKLI